jgi:hypothetical protein
MAISNLERISRGLDILRAGLFAVGVLVALLSYTVMGIYMSAVGIGIVLISVVTEGGRARRNTWARAIGPCQRTQP